MTEKELEKAIALVPVVRDTGTIFLLPYDKVSYDRMTSDLNRLPETPLQIALVPLDDTTAANMCFLMANVFGFKMYIWEEGDEIDLDKWKEMIEGSGIKDLMDLKKTTQKKEGEEEKKKKKKKKTTSVNGMTKLLSKIEPPWTHTCTRFNTMDGDKRKSEISFIPWTQEGYHALSVAQKDCITRFHNDPVGRNSELPELFCHTQCSLPDRRVLSAWLALIRDFYPHPVFVWKTPLSMDLWKKEKMHEDFPNFIFSSPIRCFQDVSLLEKKGEKELYDLFEDEDWDNQLMDRNIALLDKLLLDS